MWRKDGRTGFGTVQNTWWWGNHLKQSNIRSTKKRNTCQRRLTRAISYLWRNTRNRVIYYNNFVFFSQPNKQNDRHYTQLTVGTTTCEEHLDRPRKLDNVTSRVELIASLNKVKALDEHYSLSFGIVWDGNTKVKG